TLTHDNGARLYLNDQLIVDDWSYRGGATQHSLSGTFNATAGTVYRFRLEYLHPGSTNSGFLEAWVNGPNTGGTVSTWNFLSPDYRLAPSSPSYASSLGDTQPTTAYGPNPELGLSQSTTVDSLSGGLSLKTSAAYETQGAAGSFLRQTSKTLPGGNKY